MAESLDPAVYIQLLDLLESDVQSGGMGFTEYAYVGRWLDRHHPLHSPENEG